MAEAENRVTSSAASVICSRAPVPVQASPSLREQQLGELTAELSKASAARTEAEARATAAKEQMKLGTAESNPDVQKSQIIPRLSSSASVSSGRCRSCPQRCSPRIRA